MLKRGDFHGLDLPEIKESLQTVRLRVIGCADPWRADRPRTVRRQVGELVGTIRGTALHWAGGSTATMKATRPAGHGHGYGRVVRTIRHVGMTIERGLRKDSLQTGLRQVGPHAAGTDDETHRTSG